MTIFTLLTLGRDLHPCLLNISVSGIVLIGTVLSGAIYHNPSSMNYLIRVFGTNGFVLGIMSIDASNEGGEASRARSMVGSFALSP